MHVLSPRQEFAQRSAPHLCDMLRRINPDDFTFHATRYDSGESFRDLLCAVRRAQYLPYDELARTINAIADQCVDDGSEWGIIPCIGGYTAQVWTMCVEWTFVIVGGNAR